MSAAKCIPSGDIYEALIFDWDGTLVDSRELNYRALEAALRDCGVALDPDWYWQRQGVASPEMLVEWEQTIAPLPEPRLSTFGGPEATPCEPTGDDSR